MNKKQNNQGSEVDKRIEIEAQSAATDNWMKKAGFWFKVGRFTFYAFISLYYLFNQEILTTVIVGPATATIDTIVDKLVRSGNNRSP